MSEQKLVGARLRFRYRENSLDGILLNYLLNHPEKSLKELLWDAARMCFIPLAYFNAGGYDERNLKKLVISSFFELSRQWNYIQVELNLDLPSPKIILHSMQDLEMTAITSNAEFKDFYDGVVTPNISNDENPVNIHEQADQDDDFGDDGVEVDFGLSAEEKAIRDEMDTLFG